MMAVVVVAEHQADVPAAVRSAWGAVLATATILVALAGSVRRIRCLRSTKVLPRDRFRVPSVVGIHPAGVVEGSFVGIWGAVPFLGASWRPDCFRVERVAESRT